MALVVPGGHSVPIDFTVDASVVVDTKSREDILKVLCEILAPYIGELTVLAHTPLPNDHHYVLYAGKDSASLSVKLYASGLISATYEYFTQHAHTQLWNIDDALAMEQQLAERCAARWPKVLPAIKRGLEVNVYFSTSDDRLLEYDVTKVLYKQQTDHQKVEVIHTNSFGNILVLDNLQNLAESDLPYTHGLMNKGVDCYEGKEVLILGGGDGALLHELLKERPKHVLMIDIDEAVMDSCRKHLRSACGDTLDCYKADNYEIVVDDAFKHLRAFQESGRRFDAVFADLTDTPVTHETRGERWDFLESVMALGVAVLAEGGRYLTHTTGSTCGAALETFRQRLALQPVKDVKMTQRYVPSFMETWCFCQATRC